MREQLTRQGFARPDPAVGVVVGECSSLVEPFPKHGQADLTGRSILHQVEDAVVAEEVGWLEGCGLETATERMAVLQADTDQVASTPSGTGRVLERPQCAGVLRGVSERRERPAELVVVSHLLPHRPHDMHHLPVGHPLPRGALDLLAPPSHHCSLHGGVDGRVGADRDVRFHAALP